MRRGPPTEMTLVSAVVPSIGAAGTVGGKQRTFVVESIRSVLATANVDIDVIVVAGREMPSSVTDELRELGPVADRRIRRSRSTFPPSSTSAPRTRLASTCCC